MFISQSTQSMRKSQSVLALIIIPFLLVLSSGAGASHPVIKSIDFDGVVIDGYDAVAYFTMGHAVKGSENFSADWLGGKWLFASDEHRTLFLADPTNYVPQFGGYCSESHDVADINPAAWRIVGGRLYLFYSEGSAGKFETDNYAQSKAADFWKTVKAGLPQ